MSESGRGWFCIRCKPRQEGVAAGQLTSLPGVALLFPRVRRRRRAKDGDRLVIEPLFPGYLFAAFDPAELGGPVNHTRGVLHLVRRSGKAVDVEEKVIRELQALGEGGILNIVEPILLPGQKVRILSGLFAGEKGEVVRLAKPAQRIQVLLQLLGADQVVELAADDVGADTAGA